MTASATREEPCAWFSGMYARDLVDVSDDVGVLDGGGWWAVLQTYEGAAVCARFADVRPGPLPPGRWSGPALDSWTSSLDEAGYTARVATLRDAIAAGTVYQANLCRVLRAALPDVARGDVAGLAGLLASGNPAPYSGMIRLPAGCHPLVPTALAVVTASPELFLRRNGSLIETGPIKGTGRTAADLTDKDSAENVMIVDLMRNDLGAICRTGSIEVPALLALEQHPGLVHLVSTVRGQLRVDAGWSEVFAATTPPGSVSGAPKSSAVRLLAELEPVARGPYCGAIGWVSGRQAVLAVGIRTFWRDGDDVCFGTGAGITWGSDPVREWQETELKAERLLVVASGRTEG